MQSDGTELFLRLVRQIQLNRISCLWLIPVTWRKNIMKGVSCQTLDDGKLHSLAVQQRNCQVSKRWKDCVV